MTTPNPCGCCPVDLAGCHLAPVTAQFSDLLSAPVLSSGNTVATYTNVNGSGIDVVFSTAGAETLAGAGASGLLVNPAPPGSVTITITFSAPVMLRQFELVDLDQPSGNEFARTFSVPFVGVGGQLVVSNSCAPGVAPCVRGTVNNSAGPVFFGGAVTSGMTFVFTRPVGFGQFIRNLAFDLQLPEFEPVFAMICDGQVRWFNTAGDEVAAATVVPCP